MDYLHLRKSNMSHIDPSFVLSLIDDNTSKSIKKYQEYVIQYQDMEDPLKKSYHHIALGNETFIERIKEKIEHLRRRREIPQTRFLSQYDAETMITKMAQVLNIERKAIFDKKRGNLNRSLAIYLMKRFTPLSLVEIGELFKMDYSAVSQAAKRFEQKSQVNDEIREKIEKVIMALKEI